VVVPPDTVHAPITTTTPAPALPPR
jgi:hypothetical protein